MIDAIARGAGDPRWAPRYQRTTLQGWLAMTGMPERRAERLAEAFCASAVRTLLDEAEAARGKMARDLIGAAARLGTGLGSSPHERGRIAEIEGRLEDAAAAFAEAKSTPDRVRALRKAGRWSDALAAAGAAPPTSRGWRACAPRSSTGPTGSRRGSCPGRRGCFATC